jgi:hypothetical protein
MIEKRQQIRTWYIWKLHSFWSIALLGEPDNITIPTPYRQIRGSVFRRRKKSIVFLMYVLNIPLPHWTAVAVRLFEKSGPFTV